MGISGRKGCKRTPEPGALSSRSHDSIAHGVQSNPLRSAANARTLPASMKALSLTFHDRRSRVDKTRNPRRGWRPARRAPGPGPALRGAGRRLAVVLTGQRQQASEDEIDVGWRGPVVGDAGAQAGAPAEADR